MKATLQLDDRQSVPALSERTLSVAAAQLLCNQTAVVRF